MKLKILICMLINSITIQASEHEVPPLLLQAGFKSSKSYIPDNIDAQQAECRNDYDLTKFYENHPIHKYRLDSQSID